MNKALIDLRNSKMDIYYFILNRFFEHYIARSKRLSVGDLCKHY